MTPVAVFVRVSPAGSANVELLPQLTLDRFNVPALLTRLPTL